MGLLLLLLSLVATLVVLPRVSIRTLGELPSWKLGAGLGSGESRCRQFSAGLVQGQSRHAVGAFGLLFTFIKIGPGLC